MGRTPCCNKNGLKKGPWTPEEDQKLLNYIHKHGHGSWRTLPKNAGLARCGKSCRLRWTNYLRPDIKRGRFSFEEEETIIQLHSILGNKWSVIAANLPGRTDNEIKNFWNTHIRKRLLRMGIDPVILDLSTLLFNNPLTMYNNPAQFDVPQLLNNNTDPLVNSDFLRVASNLLSPQCQDSSNQLVPFSSFQQVPICTTSNTDAQLLSESQVMMQPNVGQFQPINDQANLWTNCNFQENCSPSAYLANTLQDCGLPGASNSGSGLSNTPVWGIPAQLNSGNSTYMTSSTAEEERDSYCCELFRVGIPELLDVGDFL